MKITRLVGILLLLAAPLFGYAVAPYPAAGNSEFSEAQQAEIRRIVMNYLLTHPEMIQTIRQAPGVDGCVLDATTSNASTPRFCGNTPRICPPQ